MSSILRICVLLSFAMFVKGEYTSCYSTPVQSVTMPDPAFRYVNHRQTCSNLSERRDVWKVKCVEGFEIVQTYTKFKYEMYGLCNTCKDPICEIQHVCCKVE